MTSPYCSIDWLRQHCEMIHYFGLGFIQVKFKPVNMVRTRMHFYTKELPPITPQEDVHNHRYGFTSEILKGEFIQSLWDVVDGDKYVLEKESCKAGVEVNEPGRPVNLKLIGTNIYVAGSRYGIPHTTFHSVQADDAITLLRLGKVEKDFAEVVRKKDSEKVCPFSQKVEEARLWEIVESMVK